MASLVLCMLAHAFQSLCILAGLGKFKNALASRKAICYYNLLKKAVSMDLTL